VTDSISDQGVGGQPLGDQKDAPTRGSTEGPDPAIGAGITLLGIFLMGTGGARDAHYVFDAGVVTGVLGAALFVLFVALSAMKQRLSS
jgi:energy-converting hydrogenase Eha subunit A